MKLAPLLLGSGLQLFTSYLHVVHLVVLEPFLVVPFLMLPFVI